MLTPRAALVAIAALLALTTSCRNGSTPQNAGIDLKGMDTSVQPGDDFNAYANGGWVKATPIPADKASYGILTILADQTRAQTRGIIEDAAKSGGGSGDDRQIGDYYASYMDEPA